MPRPESPEHGLVFDLDAVDDEMRRAAPYERDGHTTRTLLHLDDCASCPADARSAAAPSCEAPLGGRPRGWDAMRGLTHDDFTGYLYE